MTAELLRLHVNYTGWASRRLLEAAAALTPEELTRDFGTATKSVLGTLVHIMAADRIWLRRVQGESPTVIVNPDEYDLAVLKSKWVVVLDEWSKWVSGLDDDTVRSIVRYKTTEGREYAQPIWQIVLHVVNHGTHHRGQVSGFLRALSRTPPPLDLSFFYREKK